MSDKIEPLIKRASLPLAAVMLLVGNGIAPEHSEEYMGEMAELEPLINSLNDYDGYRKLLLQAGLDKTLEIIRMIENSKYPAMIKAIIEVESLWKVDALSHMDARGLMQIRPVAAMHIDPDQLFEPVTNVKTGIEIFEDHMKYFTDYDAARHWALTSYNRGRKGTFDLKMYPPRTRYSTKVLGLMMAA